MYLWLFQRILYWRERWAVWAWTSVFWKCMVILISLANLFSSRELAHKCWFILRYCSCIMKWYTSICLTVKPWALFPLDVASYQQILTMYFSLIILFLKDGISFAFELVWRIGLCKYVNWTTTTKKLSTVLQFSNSGFGVNGHSCSSSVQLVCK